MTSAVVAQAGSPARVVRVPRTNREWAALVALLVATAVGYLSNLAAGGYGNAFYAAAVQAGTKSWKAFFFGSVDSSNFITVDKPPASLWVMELSGRLFGFSTWSMLVPQVLLALAAVAVLYATVRRIAGPGAALLAGLLLAVTPVVVLMFRYDNPDALLTLLLTVAGYTTVRAVEGARARWLLLTGLVVGLAFLTKELQAFLAVPGLAIAYLWAAPTSVGRRLLHLLGAGAAIVVGAGWWVLAVALWPAADRPYLGGSTDNTELSRALGYNGLSRLVGAGRPGGAPRAAEGADVARHLAGRSGGGFGEVGLTRMFGSQIAGQVSWLLPAALVLLVAGLWLTRRAPRTDLTRAALLMFGGWLLAGGLVLSFMRGTFHSYYALVLAPPLIGLVAVGGREVWRTRHGRPGRLLLAAVTVGTAVWSLVLLDRTPSFAPGLSWFVVLAGLAVTAVLLTGRTGAAVLAAALVVGLAGPAAYALDTVATAHSGFSVSAGPALPIGDLSRRPQAQAFARRGLAFAPRVGGGAPADRFPGSGRSDGGTTAALDALLRGAGTRWSAATAGSSAAAALELATGTAVMGIGGFTGSDPTPTLAQFQADVRDGQVRYFVAPGAGPGVARGGTAGRITAWVQQHYTPTAVGGRTVYDLRPKG